MYNTTNVIIYRHSVQGVEIPPPLLKTLIIQCLFCFHQFLFSEFLLIKLSTIVFALCITTISC